MHNSVIPNHLNPNILQRLLIFGGTFNPIHNGHLAIANRLYEVFQHPITFMPNIIPPYKAVSCVTAAQRLEMLELALMDNPRFNIDSSEIQQATYSYTYKTVSRLRERYGMELPIYWLIGSDSLHSLNTWEYWQELLDVTNLVVARRPGYVMTDMSEDLQSELLKRQSSDFDDLSYSSGKIYLLDFTPLNISSTQIRQLLKQNQPITDLVPQVVARYIFLNKLYTY